jgi:cytochrome oxidase assembly protein ShyY1
VRFLFKPGWIAFVLVVIAFVVACYTLLAPWQFRRNAEQAEQNRQIAASFVNPPRPLDQLVPAGSTPGPAVEWRQAVVRGQYLPADEAVVRLRTVLGRPAFEVLTAFRTEDGRTVAVDRGYVRPGEDRHVSLFPPAPVGTVALTGRIRLDESDPGHRASLESGGHRQLYAADSHLLAQAIGAPVAAGYLQLVDGQPGGLGALPLPDSDSGPFLSYAWQWLSFGAMAIFGLVYFIRLELLQRRHPEDDEYLDSDDALAGGDQTGGDQTGGDQTGVGAVAPEPTKVSLRDALRGTGPGPAAARVPARPVDLPAEPDRDRLIDRYGKARF